MDATIKDARTAATSREAGKITAEDIERALYLHARKAMKNAELDEVCKAAKAAYIAWDGSGGPPKQLGPAKVPLDNLV